MGYGMDIFGPFPREREMPFPLCQRLVLTFNSQQKCFGNFHLNSFLLKSAYTLAFILVQ